MDKKAIIERGYCLQEEYEAILAEKQLIKLKVVPREGSNETLWVYPLEPYEEDGARFHFLFCNDPLMFFGAPRPVTGMIGIATSKGPTDFAIALADECIPLFSKAGQAAIDYFNSLIEKTEKKQ